MRMQPRRWQLAILIVVVSGAVGFGGVQANVLGAGDRLDRVIARMEVFLDPPPDRPTVPTVVVTPRPIASEAPPPTPDAIAGDPNELPSRPAATSTPAPVREPVDVELVADYDAVFESQLTNEDCAVAGTQMVLAMLGLGPSTPEFQQEIKDRIGDWESLSDSLNGGWGPAAVSEALADYGATNYAIRAYTSHTDALRDAAIAMSETRKPVVMFPWWGAHTWVMTGYRADADPTIFPDASVTGAYILDPWFPRTSSIWGESDPPGTFEDLAELERNWPVGTPMGIGPGWSRPEGPYPDRDGKYVLLLPTTPLASGGDTAGS